jgi:hypothetical protein
VIEKHGFIEGKGLQKRLVEQSYRPHGRLPYLLPSICGTGAKEKW